MSIESDVEVLKNDIQYIREFLEVEREAVKSHIVESTVYRDKVNRFDSFMGEFRSHIISDRWMFTTVIGLLVFIIGKLFSGF